ncbi:MAG: branched-chain amino acid ABC transporter permease [Candidatus Hydrogenedentota bacterium]
MTRDAKLRLSGWILTILFLASLPRLLPVTFVLGDYRIDLGLHHATLCALFVIMAMGVNLSIGFAGLLDLGFIAFIAIGSYMMSISLTFRSPVPWWIALVLAILVAGTVRATLGATCLRLRGDYLAIVTLGFGEITRVALKNNLFGLTGGPDGIFLGSASIPDFLDQSRNPVPLYFLSLAFAAGSSFALSRWKRSRAGRAWEAVREDETAAAASGINIFRARLWAYGLGGAFGGLAGGLFAIYNTISHPSDYDFVESVKIVAMVVLGGMGSTGGVIAGSVLFLLLLEIFRGLAEYRMLIFGATLVCLMLFRPQGLAGRRS